MDYLFAKLFLYVMIAFLAGIGAGWVSCSRTED